jgi:hypothetical protein
MSASARARAMGRAALRRFKQATGGAAWDAVHTLHCTGIFRTGGLNGTFESFEELRTGRYTTSFRLGPMARRTGFDGRAEWSLDGSGSVHLADAPQSRAAAVGRAHRAARAYWFPARMAAELYLDRMVQQGERRFRVVHVAPLGGRAYEMWLDDESDLLDRIVDRGDNEIINVFHLDYRATGPIRLAHTIRMSAGDPADDREIILTDARIETAAHAQRYSIPTEEIEDYVIAGREDAVSLPFELCNAHVFVRAQIDGRGPVRMLVDTGGVNALDLRAARALGIEHQGSMTVRGSGENAAALALARVSTLALGGIVLRDQVFYVIDLGRLDEVEGVAFAGLIGFEIFKRFVTTIDYAGQRLTFVRPERFASPGQGAVVPFVFNGRVPQVHGTLDGVPGQFTVDTGSRGSLTLHAPFVAEHALLEKYAPTPETVHGWGVGGPVRARLAYAGTFALGDVEVPGPAIALFTGGRGAYAARHVAGNIGGGLLQRFNVTFDYGRQRIYLERNRWFSHPEGHDRAGMWIHRAGDAFLVEDVVSGGPAVQAGVQIGDRILVVDGCPVAGLDLSATRASWRRMPPGTRVRLVVERAGRSFDSELILRDLV